MRKKGTWVVVALSCALWLGCLYDPYEWSSTGGSSAYSVEAGWLAGDLPSVGTFDADAYRIEEYIDQVTLHVGREGGEDFGWAMTRLQIDVEALAATSGTVSTEALATGCAGPSHGNWDWDQSTSNVEVVVSPGASEDERVVSFTADFGGGNQTHGGFTLRLR